MLAVSAVIAMDEQGETTSTHEVSPQGSATVSTVLVNDVPVAIDQDNDDDEEDPADLLPAKEGQHDSVANRKSRSRHHVQVDQLYSRMARSICYSSQGCFVILQVPRRGFEAVPR
jgi:hypothetical protein